MVVYLYNLLFFGLPNNQGGIEDGEEPKSAAIRELQDETGVVSAEIIAEVCRRISALFLHLSYYFSRIATTTLVGALAFTFSFCDSFKFIKLPQVM